MTNQNFQSLDMDYFKQIAERRNKRIEAERAEALRKKNEPKQEVQEEEQAEKIIRMPESAEPKKDYVFVPSLGLYLSENRYLQDKDWNQTQKILHKEGRRMPTIPEFVELLKYLRSKDGKSKLKNAEKILDEIYTVRGPYRAEWLDAKFEEKNGMYVAYHTFDSKGSIVQKSDELEEYLTEDKIPGINLEFWLDDSTKQGLPEPKVAKGDLYYWYPRDGAVAGFSADSGRADLDCDGYPDDRDAGLGVRYVEPIAMGEDRAKNAKSQFSKFIDRITRDPKIEEMKRQGFKI